MSEFLHARSPASNDVNASSTGSDVMSTNTCKRHTTLYPNLGGTAPPRRVGGTRMPAKIITTPNPRLRESISQSVKTGSTLDKVKAVPLADDAPVQ